MNHRGSQFERLVDDYRRKLATREEVLAVGLFGSHARGMSEPPRMSTFDRSACVCMIMDFSRLSSRQMDWTRSPPQTVSNHVTRLASWKDWVSRRATMNGRKDLFRHGEAIPSSEIELKSASDCLEERDIEGAALQVRCATVVLCGATTKLLSSFPRETAEAYAERYEAARMLNPRFADFLLRVHGVDGSRDQYLRTKRSLNIS